MKSYQRREAIWQTNRPSPTEKLILLALEDFCGDNLDCFPSQATLAKMTGYNTKTIQRALRSLEAKGLIETATRYDADGRQTSNNYVLRFAQMLIGFEPTPLTYELTKDRAPRVTDPPRPRQATPLPSDRLPPKLPHKEPIQKEPTHSEAGGCVFNEGLAEQATRLGVDLADDKLRATAQQYPERIDEAIACLADAKNVAQPTQFLQAAIEKGWRSRATGPRKQTAPVGFGEWFTEARRRGVAIASEMRDGAVWIFTGNQEWRLFGEMSQQPWPT